MGKFLRIWNGISKLFSLLLPFGKSAGGWQMKPGPRRLMRIVLLVAILAVLWWLNKYVAPDIPTRWVHNIFLPMIGLVIFLLIWVGYGIWRLMHGEVEAPAFPDIDAAWETATTALGQAGIKVGDLPLFLVLGKPQELEVHLFEAAQLPLVLKQTPSEALAPIHVYATREAIYVTCAGASLMGKHAANIALEGIEEQGGAEEETFDDATLKPDQTAGEVIGILRRGRTMTMMERRDVRRKYGKPVSDLLNKPEEMELLKARLAHLGRLLVNARQPLCPINGVIVLVPIGGTDTEQEAQQTAELCARDLANLRDVLRQHFSQLVLCCDLETLPGFRDFIQLATPKERRARIGQRFPLASPDLTGDELLKKISESIDHMCNKYLRDRVYRLFSEDADGPANAIAKNTGLYLFLDEMHARSKHLSRVLTHGIAKGAPYPLLYAGCYLAGTGVDKDSDQAFVAGVFKRLLDEKLEDKVSWSEQALADDRYHHHLANLGCMFLILLLMLALCGVIFVFFFKGAS